MLLARSSTIRPSAICSVSQSERSWSASNTRSPSRNRALRRESWSRIIARSPCTPPLSGLRGGGRTPEPQPLRPQVAAAAVALVEDQVDDSEHGGKPIRHHVVRRHPERDSGGLDLSLCPDQPLRHRRLGHEEGARYLLGGEPAEGPKCEGHLSLDGESRMTAGEDELESFVRERRRAQCDLRCLLDLEQSRLHGQRAITANAIDGSVACGRHEPGARIGGVSVARPPLRGDRESLLRGLLGKGEIAEEGDQGGEHASPLVAESLLEDRYHSIIGRTSTAPPRRAAGILAASSSAASRSSAS